MEKDLAWGVRKTPLHLALMEGRLLDARRLLAQGVRPDEDTLKLARQQDRLATHALLKEMGLEAPLLPGSDLAGALRVRQAHAQADAMALTLPLASGQSKGAQGARL